METRKKVGLDIAKRSLKLVRYNDSEQNHEWLDTRTTETGIRKMLNWLKENDTVVMEAGNMSFRLAKRIKKSKGCEVIVLNPGDIQLIYKSLKKTDAEDALKLARIAYRNPREELPEVNIPSDEEEVLRALSTEQEYWTKLATMNKNRLHGLFHQSGLTTITKSQLKSSRNRKRILELLKNSTSYEPAERLVRSLENFDIELRSVNEQIKNKLRNNDQTRLLMSMPGIGPITVLAILGYLGNFSRFSHAKQVSHYSGFVPRIDQSGDSSYYGPIIKRGCKPIKRALVQGAWALVKSPHGGELRDFYERLCNRGKNKRVAIIATSRKMLTTLYGMMKTGNIFSSMPEEMLNKKLKYYGLI